MSVRVRVLMRIQVWTVSGQCEGVEVRVTLSDECQDDCEGEGEGEGARWGSAGFDSP